MRRSAKLYLTFLPTLLITMFACRAASIAGSTVNVGSDATEDDTIKRRVYDGVSRDEEKGFTRKKPPQSGEWLFTQHERPQPFEQYRVNTRVRPTAERRTIVLQPLGEMNAEQKRMVEDMREYAEAFFQLPARIEKPMELKTDAPGKDLKRPPFHSVRREGYEAQYNADVILDSILIKKIPADAVVYLGITMEDLFSGDLHYVFGLGSIEQRIGVYSLCRYFPEFWNQKRLPDAEVTALRRACKVLNHETGHMFGMQHCVFYDCSMNGSMSLPETDAAPIHFCPVCQKKLLWNIGCDAEKRGEALRTFYAKHGLKEEAAFMESSLVLIHKSAELEKARKVKDE